MNHNRLSNTGRRIILLVALVALLAACGRQPDLTLPTPVIAPTEAVGVATETVAVQTAAPTLSPTTTTQLPTPAQPPTVRPSSTPAPATLAPTATLPAPTSAAPSLVGGGSYQVAFVESNDALNVRSGPGANYEAVEELAPIAAGIAVEENSQAAVAGSTWVYIEADEAEGWVNGRFLTESVSTAEFCAAPEAQALIDTLRQAIATQDGRLLASLVHPERGLRLRLNWWNEEILLTGADTAGVFSSEQSYDWGTSEGSGEAISGSFSEVMLPPLQRDLLPATETACDEILSGPTAGMVMLPDGYQQVHYFSLHRPAPADVEFDWGSWAVGVERWQGNFYLSYLVHYNYEI